MNRATGRLPALSSLSRLVKGCLGLAWVLAAAAGAQPASGDLVLADARSTTRGKLFARSPAGVFTTLFAGFSGYFPNWISMAADNRSVFVPFGEGVRFSSGFLARVAPTGVLSVLTTLGSRIGFSNGQEPDGDGTYVNAGNQGVLFRFDPVALQVSTITPVPTLLNEVAVNRDDGSYAGVIYPAGVPGSPGSLVRYDPGTSALTTLLRASARISQPSGLVHDPATGDYVVSRFAAPGVVRVNAATRHVTTLWSRPGANALALTPRGTFLVATETSVREIDARGVILKTITFPTLLRITGVAEYGDRRLTAAGAAAPGTTVTLDINPGKPSDAGQSYFLAASLATRPAAAGALPNGEVLHLAADALFFATATNAFPTVFVNFQGVLDARAHGRASVAIPSWLPRGLNLPVHVGGLVANPGAPGGVSTVLSSVTFVLR